jgi:HlyD family secretion protein
MQAGVVFLYEVKMNRFTRNRRILALAVVLLPLVALFAYSAVRSGPLAPIAVTTAAVERAALNPRIFGIGTVEARYTYRIGPTVAGRLGRLDVHVGDHVRAGQVLGEMDPVDLDQRIRAQQAALQRAEAGIQAAAAKVQEAAARKTFSAAQLRRYDSLRESQIVSAETTDTKRQESHVAEAGFLAATAELDAARREAARVRSDLEGWVQQRANLRLVAPVDGLVAARAAEPGSTVVAGQAVVEVIDPGQLWISVRFDQVTAAGLRAGLTAQIALRSMPGPPVAGRVLRIEPLADAVTEELLAKVVFAVPTERLPAIGELAEVTVTLAGLPEAAVVPGAGVHRNEGRLGVWVVDDGVLRFATVKTGAQDLDGRIQILEGVNAGEQIVVYSQRALAAGSRIKIVERLPGVSP